MSVKVDTERSTKARTEGNASFKKGKWTEAIGHYTTAIVFDSQDGLGYTNRAAAYLKLEKWKDAERDCTSAISLPKGENNVKALYRRALARKALADVEGAMEDIQAVLAIEPSNDTAREELVELKALQQQCMQSGKERIKKANDLPPSPPRTSKPQPIPARASATIEEINDVPEISLPAQKIDTSLKEAETARSSFADLKKGRQAKKTFTTSTTSVPSAIPAPSTRSPPSSERDQTARSTSPSSLPIDKVSISEPLPSKLASRSNLSCDPLPLLDPTIPGSALSLVSAIRTHSPQATWPVLAHLSDQPAAVGKMLDNFLEPDQLALILARLRDTIGLDLASREERQTVVRNLIAGLRMTKRWGMTAMMMSSKEKQLGQEVWTSAGGTGDWTKRT